MRYPPNTKANRAHGLAPTPPRDWRIRCSLDPSSRRDRPDHEPAPIHACYPNAAQRPPTASRTPPQPFPRSQLEGLNALLVYSGCTPVGPILPSPLPARPAHPGIIGCAANLPASGANPRSQALNRRRLGRNPSLPYPNRPDRSTVGRKSASVGGCRPPVGKVARSEPPRPVPCSSISSSIPPFHFTSSTVGRGRIPVDVIVPYRPRVTLGAKDDAACRRPGNAATLIRRQTPEKRG